MKLKFLLLTIVLIFLFPEFTLSQFNYTPGKINNNVQLTGEDYITGEDGVPRMSVNIWGHVSRPGAYLVYDGIDILTCLSMAGGPLKGAKLSNVTIVSEDGSSKKIDISRMLDKNDSISVQLKPYDTIYIDQTIANYILLRSGFINTLLQLTNLIFTINN